MSYWSPAGPRQAHLLVVDDNVDELKLLVEVLRGTGYRITLAFDALEGYRRATALKPDLIILDVRMGSVDGYAICRLLKEDPTTANAPVIFVTSATSLEQRLTGLRSGGADYIHKPFDSIEVLTRIEVHLALAGGRRPLLKDDRMGRTVDDLAEKSLPSNGGDMERSMAHAAERLILSELGKVLSLRDLAMRVGTHEKRLTKVFKEHTGSTVFEFMREARLHKAQQFLSVSALRIDEVAAAVGFSSAANFITAFRQRFGCTPRTYRQLHGERKQP